MYILIHMHLLIHMKVLFESDQQAHHFTQYVLFLMESGSSVKSAYTQIDYMKQGFIDAECLMKACVRVDLRVSEEDTTRM
jgi:hypothetical protein